MHELSWKVKVTIDNNNKKQPAAGGCWLTMSIDRGPFIDGWITKQLFLVAKMVGSVGWVTYKRAALTESTADGRVPPPKPGSYVTSKQRL